MLPPLSRRCDNRKRKATTRLTTFKLIKVKIKPSHASAARAPSAARTQWMKIADSA